MRSCLTHFVVGGSGNRRDHLVERDRDRLCPGGIDVDLPRRRVEVARREVPVLPFAAVHRQLDDVAVGAAERLVPVEERLDGVRALRNAREALDRIAEDGRVEDRIPPGGRPLHVDAEDLLRLEADVICFRGSSDGSVDSMRKTRPSSGAALRSLGKETAKRRGRRERPGGVRGRPSREEPRETVRREGRGPASANVRRKSRLRHEASVESTEAYLGASDHVGVVDVERKRSERARLDGHRQQAVGEELRGFGMDTDGLRPSVPEISSRPFGARNLRLVTCRNGRTTWLTSSISSRRRVARSRFRSRPCRSRRAGRSRWRTFSFRIADTFEDASHVSPEVRIRALRDFIGLVAASRPDEAPGSRGNGRTPGSRRTAETASSSRRSRSSWMRFVRSRRAPPRRSGDT